MEPEVIPQPPTQTPKEAKPEEVNTEPSKESSSLKQIRTFEGDVAEAIRKQNESLISIQRAEEKKREAMKTLGGTSVAEEEHHLNLKPLLMSLLTLVLIGGGAYASHYAFTTYKEKTTLPTTERPPNRFIETTLVTRVDASTLGRQSLIDIIEGKRLEERDSSAVEQLDFRRGLDDASELLSTPDFLDRLASHAPNPLVRSFGDLFMFGVFGENPSNTFMLIELKSFANAFPGMLEWESRMVEDILPLFADRNVFLSIASGAEFKDKTIQNHDTRFLRDPNGNTVLIYGFFENRMVIITDTEESFRTIVNRLQSQKLSR